MRARRTRRAGRVLASATAVLGSLTACSDDGPAEGAVVVHVASQPCDRPVPRDGWGVVVSPGRVLTAGHVVDGAVRRTTVDGTPAAVVHVDAETDLAVLDVAAFRGAGLRRALGTADAAAGDDVTVRTGEGELATHVERVVVLEVRDVSADTTTRRPAIVLRGAVPGGTSGAPVLDVDGALVGVVTLVDRDDALTYATASRGIADTLDASSSTWRTTGPNLDPTVTCS